MTSTRRWPPALCAVITFIGLAFITGGLNGLSAAGIAQQKKGAAPATTGATAPRTGIPPKSPVAASEESVKAGRAVYAKICRNCHGLTGKGDGISAPPGSKPANLIDAEWKFGRTDADIFYTIKYGVKPFDVMEPWGKKVSDADIWNTINYVRDLAKPKAGKK
jgi:mono/diheme cytochrome c family protein